MQCALQAVLACICFSMIVYLMYEGMRRQKRRVQWW